ncbi:GntR family transcriptional regulator [Desulfitobacterium sp. LBE]|uniref:GntR family transcriptional regulator n=1 Tax=Desulfitobacterium sp. LBE TaxID=884086 RepID=UPI00119B4762|nr:GntR family transcriptional regulator [Desulfitobacterium sp. LBE]TWH56226.1 GntR family transcriptional regulator [Desulfitobacterium sp. LBE]
MNEEQFIDKNSVIPIYYQLAKLLESQILRGELKPGEALPTETEIANRFEISRMTVRRAIAELITAGMVHAQQGKGTFVSPPKLNNVVFELNNFNQEIKDFGLKLSTTLLGAHIVRADERLMRIFQLDSSTTRLLYFRTVVSAEDERLAYERKYTIYSKSKPILESNLQDPTLSGLVTANNDVLPVSTKKVLQVSVTTAEEAAILGIGVNAPVFVIEETLYDLENKPVGWSKSIYRGDRYQLTGYDGWLRKDNHGGINLG